MAEEKTVIVQLKERLASLALAAGPVVLQLWEEQKKAREEAAEEKEAALPITVDAFDYLRQLLEAAVYCPNKQMRAFHIACARTVFAEIDAKTKHFQGLLDRYEKALLEEVSPLQ